MIWRSSVAFSLVLAMAVGATAQEASSIRFAGRPLAEALQLLRAQGLRLVFSTDLVRREMRVKDEPKSRTARELLDEILQPHRLMARDGPGGVISIVAVPRPSDPPPPPKPVARGSIQGRVVDAGTGAAMAGVLVRVADDSVTSDVSGHFLLVEVPAGRQSLYVSTVGYALAKPLVNVEPDRTAQVTVPLAAGAGTYTEQVLVRADTSRGVIGLAPSHQSVDSADLQDLRGVLADDPMRAVQSLPGMVATDDFTSKFSIRGSDFAHVGVSLDGVSTAWLLHEIKGAEDTGSIALVNGDVLDQVTVASGPYSQRLGDRTGGWVAFELREGSRVAPRIRAAISMTNASVIAEGPWGKSRRGSWIASARQSYLDLVIRRLDWGSSPAFGFTDGHVKAVYDVSPRHQVQMMLLGGRSTFSQEGEGIAPNAVRDGQSRTGLATAAVRSTWSRVVLTNRAIAVGEDYLNLGRVESALGSGTSSDFGFRSDVSIAARPSLLLNAGTEIRRQHGSWDEQVYEAPGGVTVPSGPARSGTATESRGSAYIEGLWRRGRVEISPGLRWTQSSVAVRGEVSPWLLASWQIADRWRVKGGTAVHHQFADLRQMAWYAQGRELSAERARHADVAVERTFSAWRWQIGAFHRQDDDLLRLEDAEARLIDGAVAGPSPEPHLENALHASTAGVDALVQVNDATRLVGWVSYTFGHTRVTDVLTGETFDGDFDQRHTFNAYGRYRVSPRTTISGKLRLGSNVPIAGYFEQREGAMFLSDRRNLVRLPVYARLDARLNHVFNFTKRRLTLFVEVLNVLNRDNYGPDDGTVAFRTGRAVGFTRALLPILPSAGLIVEF